MGGIGLSIRVEEGAEPCEPMDLHGALFEHLRSAMYRALGRRQNGYALGEYMSDSRYDGYEHGTWAYDEARKEMSYSFRDMAGCCNVSMTASVHWFEVAFALERPSLVALAERRGWKLLGPDWTVGEMVRFGTHYPLLYIGESLYATARRPRGQPLEEDAIFGDDGTEPPRISELDAPTRAKVERIAITGRCDCELCSLARKRLKPKTRRGERKPLDEKKTYENVPSAWALFESDEATAELCRAAGPVIRTFTEEQWSEHAWGPPELQVLADWLESKGAPVATTDLTRMVYHFTA